MGAIFLSYARPDRAFAEKLARTLEAAGHDVWWDRRIDGGSEFSDEIETALNQAEAVIVVWSSESIRSRWVRDEAAAGGDTGRLVPVLIDAVQPPMGFRQFQSIDLAGWKGGARDSRTADLLRSVDQRLAAAGKDPAAGKRPPAARASAPSGRRRWVLVAALLLAVAVAGFWAWRTFYRSAGPRAKSTFVLAPFEAPTSDTGLRGLAAKSREALADSLSNSGIPVRVAESNSAGTGDFRVSANFDRDGDKVSATVRLDETTNGVAIYSRQFEASGADAANLPGRIGAQIASMLSWGAPQMALDMHGAYDPAIIGELLQQHDFSEDSLQGYQHAQRAAAKAPGSADAQLALAFDTAFVLGDLPLQDRGAALVAARAAADRAIALAPKFGDTYATWCFLHSETRLVECEDRLRAAKRIDSDAPFVDSFLGRLRRSVGAFEEAEVLQRLSYAHDPYIPTKIGWMLQMMEFTGDHEEARRLSDQGVRWWPGFAPFFASLRISGLLDAGDFAGARRVELEVGAKSLPPKFVEDGARIEAALVAKSPPAARQVCGSPQGMLPKVRCMLVLAKLGALDDAFVIAQQLYPARLGSTPADTERIWFNDPEGIAPLEFVTAPAAAPLRRDPRYLALAQRTGLLAYWRSGRPPDFCRGPGEPICRQLLGR